MILVQEEPEPGDFHDNVRQRGQRFLAKNPRPTSAALSAHPYWRRAAKQLYDAYDGICAYTCHWIAFDTGSRTVEHFVPKSVAPSLAYEWSNFRLVCGRLNSRKREAQDVLDPFALDNGVFCIDFPSVQIRPFTGLSVELETCAWRTIDRLSLNDETCISARLGWIQDYCGGYIEFDYLRRRAPFLHREIRRQSLVAPKICEVMGFVRASC